MRFVVVGVAVGLSLPLGCSGAHEDGQCQYQSSSSSGGICRIDLTCGGLELAASCTDTDCVCIVGGSTTEQRFVASGFCAQSTAEQRRLVEANCALPADAGSTADASGVDPSCPPLAYTGMACRAEEMGPTCPGTAACFCTGPINIVTSCVCEEGTAFGRAWRCGDDCTSACAADGGTLDTGPAPDGGGAATACLLAPECLESTTGSAASLALVADICGEAGGTLVPGCATDHHDRCVAPWGEVVFYTDRSDPTYDPVASRAACDQIGGVFTP